MATILTLTSLPEGSKTGDYIKATKSTQGLIQGEVYAILDVGNNEVVHISSDNFDPSILTGETIFYDGTKDKSIKAAIDLKANLLADVVEINSSFELTIEHSGKIIICNNSDPISITLDTAYLVPVGRAIDCQILRHNGAVNFVDELSITLRSVEFNELVHVVNDGSHWHLWGTEDSSGDVEEAPIDGKQYARKDGAWEEVAAGGGVEVIDFEDLIELVLSSENDDVSSNSVAVKPAGYYLTYYPDEYDTFPPFYVIVIEPEGSTTRVFVANYLVTVDGSFQLRGARTTIDKTTMQVVESENNFLDVEMPQGLTKSQVEDDQDDTFGLVSGERLAQAIAKHGGGGGGVEEAPIDGKTYVRTDGAWEEITSVNVVQTAGQSTTDVMSQKTVTDALEGKVDKVQTKEIVTANKILTAADSGKLLIINSDGITITMPANSDFNIDIAKMDEDFITIVQCAGTDKFREDSTTISVIRDVGITNSGITGKEWLAIGAYEV